MSSYTHDLEAASRHGEVLAERAHRPWPLPDGPWIAYGIELSGEPVLHYAHRQDVVFWPLAPLEQG